MRDEGYRYVSRGEMGGWLWVSAKCPRAIVQPVEPKRGHIPYDADPDQVSARM